MIVREFNNSDWERIRELHKASGLEYELPDLDSFFCRRVAGDGENFGMAALLRLTAEAALVCDPHWRTPAWRMEALRQLSRACNDDAKKAGVSEVVAFIHPQLLKTFGRRLTRLGWSSYKGEEWRAFGHAVI